MDGRARDGKCRCVQYECFASGVSDGVGAAIERSPEDVLGNVRQGYVSVETARNDYGVAIRANGGQFTLDPDATRSLRLAVGEPKS